MSDSIDTFIAVVKSSLCPVDGRLTCVMKWVHYFYGDVKPDPPDIMTVFTVPSHLDAMLPAVAEPGRFKLLWLGDLEDNDWGLSHLFDTPVCTDPHAIAAMTLSGVRSAYYTSFRYIEHMAKTFDTPRSNEFLQNIEEYRCLFTIVIEAIDEPGPVESCDAHESVLQEWDRLSDEAERQVTAEVARIDTETLAAKKKVLWDFYRDKPGDLWKILISSSVKRGELSTGMS